MNSNNLIVREYLSSLKEDTELDYLFPLLLTLMGFRIVQTPKEAKGQSQYGKDIIAIGNDINGVKHKWYFELKGYADKDVNDITFFKRDGIKESLIEAKYTAFKDITIPGFNNLPEKIVLVHNSVLKANIRPTFDGFIEQEFKENQFERWDIYYLTELFNKYLFNEYLLLDDESNRLFKKTLAFLDSPDNDYSDFKNLVVLQFDKFDTVRDRAFEKLFATLGLLLTLILHYSRENNYLVPAKECSKFLILYTWGQIVKHKKDKSQKVLREYKKLLNRQFEIFKAYFERTFSVARLPNGLYAENGTFFEKIGYPLRCFEYVDDMIYYCRLRDCIFEFKYEQHFINTQKDLIFEVINNNSGCVRPLLDYHSITIVQLLLLLNYKDSLREKDIDFWGIYLSKIIESLKIAKIKHELLPEITNNIDLLIEAVATSIKPSEYNDSSSILIAILLELSAVCNAEFLFEELVTFIDNELSLQIVDIDLPSNDFEELLFDRNLRDIYHVEIMDRILNGIGNDKIPSDFSKLIGHVKSRKLPVTVYKTDEAGFSCIRYLAHSYFKNEILPNEWRIFLG